MQFMTMAHRYTVMVGAMPIVQDGSRYRAADVIKLARELGKPFTVTHTVTLSEYEQEECYGCQARPVTYDMDCDGPSSTTECGSDQCDWWTCVMEREAQQARWERGMRKAAEKRYALRRQAERRDALGV